MTLDQRSRRGLAELPLHFALSPPGAFTAKAFQPTQSWLCTSIAVRKWNLAYPCPPSKHAWEIPPAVLALAIEDQMVATHHKYWGSTEGKVYNHRNHNTNKPPTMVGTCLSNGWLQDSQAAPFWRTCARHWSSWATKETLERLIQGRP